jgi:cholesterol transport system auxiliary component
MRTLAITAAALALSACVSVLPDAAPASARFQVTDVAYDVAATAQADWTLSIDEPSATRAYDTTKIALSREPAKIEYYAGGEWVDRAPRIFGTALLRSFENTGAIQGVGSRTSLPVSTYVLQTDIRRFGATHSGNDVRADIEIYVRLTDARSRIYGSKIFKSSLPAARDNSEAAAKALNEGATSVQREIVAWTIEQANAAYAK